MRRLWGRVRHAPNDLVAPTRRLMWGVLFIYWNVCHCDFLKQTSYLEPR
jgi:hypothetical protein